MPKEEIVNASGIYEKLSVQLADYNDWVRAEILPRARQDFRLPSVMYRDALKNWGVDEDPEDLIKRATAGYMDIRNEMVALAPLVAAQKGFDTSDYREVIRLLKENRVTGEELLPYYQEVLGELETIIRRERLVSLPERQAGIRVGSAAETAAQPAAHLDVPRLIGNTDDFPQFVLPLLVQNDDGTWPESDDTYKAGAWTLTAHEARPGHELQFSSMIEGGVSITRGVFAFNSANVVLGESWAQNEIERYTYRIPGQATAYYYGYLNLQALRTQTEIAMGDKFDAMAFHDFILAQGLLPPEILAQAVRDNFITL